MNIHEYAVMDLYLGSFAARHDAYVKNSRAHINEELTPVVAHKAMQSGAAISGYMARWVDWTEAVHDGTTLRRECMTHVGAVDFDMDDGLEDAKRMRTNLLDDWNIPSLLVDSRRGAHLWVTSHYQSSMLPATYMRMALRNMVHMMELDPAKAEVFPKKSDADWGVGALRMPLMRHPKSGVRYSAHDMEDREVTRISDLVGVMADLMNDTSLDDLYRLAKAVPVPQTYPVPQGPYRKPSVATGDADGVSVLLNRHFGVQPNPGHSIKCPFHDDRHASLQVAKDDERCWCKSPTCEMYNDGRGYGSIELARHLERSHPLAGRPA